MDGTLYFVANDGSNGFELWKSDGTASGTVLVKDIHPSSNSNPVNLTNVNGILYFKANDGSNGCELWKSDGTTAGTVLVKDIHPTGTSDPKDLTSVAGILYYFGADNGTTGSELWKSDGTPAGTILVKDINSGQAKSFLRENPINPCFIGKMPCISVRMMGCTVWNFGSFHSF